MSSASYFVSPQQLWSRIGTADAPTILDVCRRKIYDAGPGVHSDSQWRQPETYLEWVPGLATDRPIVLACRYGHNLSQMIAAELRGRGVPAQVLEGGRQAWSEAGLPMVDKGRARSLRAEIAEPVGDAAAAEDRPRRLPVADPALHRPAGAHPLCRPAGGQKHRGRHRRDPVRHRGHRDQPRGRALLVRHDAQAVRAGRRSASRARSR